MEALSILGGPHSFQPLVKTAVLSHKEKTGYLPSTRIATIETLDMMSDAVVSLIHSSGDPRVYFSMDCRVRAATLSLKDDKQLPARLQKLGLLMLIAVKEEDAAVRMDPGIGLLSLTLGYYQEGDREKALTLLMLSLAHMVRFQKSKDTRDVDFAAEYRELAASVVGDIDDSDGWICNAQGLFYAFQFDQSRDLAIIDEAIRQQTRGMSCTQKNPGMHILLSVSHLDQYHASVVVEDLTSAIDCQSQAVSLTQEGHAERSMWLDRLGSSHLLRFDHLGKPEDINKAIACFTEAILHTPDGHIGEPGRFNNPSNSYLSRSEHPGGLTDINQAIACKSSDLLLTSNRHTDRPWLLSHLGNSYMRRFEHFGNLEDIDWAIACLWEAVLATPDGHKEKAQMLDYLGTTYNRRFNYLGELEDVERAILYQSEALLLTPAGNKCRPSPLTSLSGSLWGRFARLGNIEDLNQAIRYQLEAVLLVPDNALGRMSGISNLAAYYCQRYHYSRESEDMERAMFYYAEAALITPDNHGAKPGLLSNLGTAHKSRFLQLGDLADLERATVFFSQAVNLIADEHADRPKMLGELSFMHQLRFVNFGQPADIESSMLYMQMASQSPISRSIDRFCDSRSWARIASALRRDTALLAYRQTMELVPKVIWIGSTVSTRYKDIHLVSNVAVEAAAAAISAKDYPLALKWLEAGRSIIWNQTLQLRTPFDDLSTLAPILAERLKLIAQGLEVASRRETRATGVDLKGMEVIAQRHRRLAEEYEETLAEVRKLPGFHDFMQLKKSIDLVPAAQSGPVVVINVHTSRCDALILRHNSGDIAHVSLPALSHGRIKELQLQMQQILTSGAIRQRWPLFEDPPRIQFESILSALWYTIVEPILLFLGYATPTTPLPHITWCTTGALSFLPIHAAGCYDKSGPKIFELVVSSYTPILSALLSVQGNTLEMDGILAVGQEATPGCQSLAGTKTELAHIKRHAKERSHKLLEGDQATVDAVLIAMEQYNSVHLACHGSQKVFDPTKSCFYLHDGPLSLAAITKKAFKNKGLAFLSACETATGNEKMPDEAVHLAAGMLVAGYPTVIATMWSIGDSDAPLVADHVYGQLMQDGKLDNGRASRALHAAVGVLRDSIGENEFARWVPYIHIGI